jgi:hypothetical protein
MHETSRAFVIHRTPTRIRIKVPDRQRQERYFAALERVLIQDPKILQVDSNPLTASVVIECREGFDLTTEQRQFLGLEVVETRPVARTSYLAASRRDRGDSSDSGFGIAVLILKLVVAIATKQLGAQLIGWLIEAIEASHYESRRRAARRPPILAAPMN